MAKRILLCEFYHEINSFSPSMMDIENFKAIRLAEGREFYDLVRGHHGFQAGGMVDAIEEAGGIVIPSVSMFGSAGGYVTDRALNYFIEKLTPYLKNDTYDGIFCSFHGAAATPTVGDPCGKIVSLIRSIAGNKVPIAACYDLHANITDTLMNNCDIICGYQTYPHVDFYETGHRAGELGMRVVNGEKLYTAVAKIPMLTPPSGYTGLEGPFKDVLDIGHKAIENKELLDWTVFNVQPWMDIPEISSTTIAIAKDKETAVKKATELAEKLFEVRDNLWPNLMDIDEVLNMAEDPSVPKPVVLGDSADSPNSGCLGDSVFHALRHQERGLKSSMCLFVRDEEVVKQAFELGVGGEAVFTVGGKYTPDAVSFTGKGRVRSLHDGLFTMEGPGARGQKVSIGNTAVISFDNMDMMVCERPLESGDPQILRHFGIEPTFYDLVVVKANTSFRVPYGKFAKMLCYTDTPGVGAANLKRFKWKNLPKGMYPFDLPEDYHVEGARIYR